MYLLEFLKRPRGAAGGTPVEFRLACSGELYNRKVRTFDWRKSDITRVLLQSPATLLVVSRPFNTYPQELALRATIDPVTEENPSGIVSVTRTALPDYDIVDDLCSVLTLLSRRLVSPVTKATQKELSHGWLDDVYAGDVPMPVLGARRFAVWPRRPLTVITSVTGQEVKFNDPPPTGVDPEALSAFLTELPHKPSVDHIVQAARLYRSALELIHDRPDTAYLALISVIETLASKALSDYEPTEAEKLEKYHGAVKKTARKHKLSDAVTRELILAACRSERWLSKKFVKFCMDYCPAKAIENSDRVFQAFEPFNPSESEREAALARIYKARSENLHVGKPFPAGIGWGASSSELLRENPVGFDRPDIPPVPWFERIVSVAARRFILAAGQVPFCDEGDEP